MSELNVGARLRQLRTEQRLSLRALARKSGLNVNTLSLIENGKTSPSVKTVQQLAAALGEPITAFFENITPPQRVIHQRGSQRETSAFTHGSIARLGQGKANKGIDLFLVTMEPEAESGDTPIVHTGLEFVFCLEGEISYTIEGEEYILQPEDSLLFEAHLPHRWSNRNGTSRFLLILCPADENDQPTERHFNGE